MTGVDTVPHTDFTDLYRDHHSWLLARLYRKLGCCHRAADLTQDVFLRVLSAENVIATVQSIREPRSYLATIANRVMVDNIRRRAIEAAYLEAISALPEPQDISPEERVSVINLLQSLDAMLCGLGSNVRRAFLLSQIQGLTYREIAVRLDVSVSSVKKYMAKATEHCLVFALHHDL